MTETVKIRIPRVRLKPLDPVQAAVAEEVADDVHLLQFGFPRSERRKNQGPIEGTVIEPEIAQVEEIRQALDVFALHHDPVVEATG